MFKFEPYSKYPTSFVVTEDKGKLEGKGGTWLAPTVESWITDLELRFESKAVIVVFNVLSNFVSAESPFEERTVAMSEVCSCSCSVEVDCVVAANSDFRLVRFVSFGDLRRVFKILRGDSTIPGPGDRIIIGLSGPSFPLGLGVFMMEVILGVEVGTTS